MSRLLIILLGFFTANVFAKESISVFVSIAPQKYFVEKIGGKLVSVNVMVRPGLNPETYEPTPKQMAALEKTELYFRISVPFESVWIDKLQSINPSMTIVPCCGNTIGKELHQHEQHENTSIRDAHVWTDPKNVIELARIIYDELIKHDASNQGYYNSNYIRFVEELEDLYAEIELILKQLPHRYLIVAHPSWEYLARAFNLEQISIEQHGSEVRARKLTQLVELARKENIKTIYVQPQFSNSAARILAREINANIIELDPLAEDYIQNLREVALKIKKGAGNP